MKKSKILILSIVTLFTGTGFSSCEKNGIDVEKPTITLIEPVDGSVLLIGDEHGVHFDAEFADNEALASYKINIHANLDGHHHAPALRKTAANNSNDNDSIAFEFNQIWTDVAGKKSAKIHHHEIVIPEEINGKPVKTGEYHLMVYCLDKAGNESFAAVEIHLSNTATEEHEHEHEH